MFFDEPNRAAYKEGMSLEEFAKAAMPEEAKAVLKGKMSELSLDGITIDMAALQTFREHMVSVGTRVGEEKKKFQKAKKWLQEQYEAGLEVDRRATAAEEEKKRMRGKFLPELIITLLFFVAWYFILDKVIVPMGTDPMEVFKHVDSTWLIVWYALGSIVWLVTIFRGLISSRFKNIGRWIRLVFCVLLVGISVVAFAINYPMHAENTYRIDTAEELMAAKNFPRGTSFTLEADIDLKGAKIKYVFNKFYGTFEGHNHTISNFETKRKNQTGLFRENYGTIQNVNVSNATIKWEHSSGYYVPEFRVAVLVTENYGTVTGICKLDHIKYDYYDQIGCDMNREVDYDTCRGHVVAFNAGTVDETMFSTSNLSSVGSRGQTMTVWASNVGHTDMGYAVTPKE